MQTTTPAAIRRAFVAAIKAIVPTHEQYADKRFRAVNSVDDVPGPTLRNFHIDVPAMGQPVADGIYGSGVEFRLEVVVYVNYGGLAPEDDDSIITEDGAQIWDTLQALYDPALPGLVSVEPMPFVEGTSGDEPGYRWGAFAFDVRYLHNV
jgi:hypothetical protein